MRTTRQKRGCFEECARGNNKVAELSRQGMNGFTGGILGAFKKGKLRDFELLEVASRMRFVDRWEKLRHRDPFS